MKYNSSRVVVNRRLLNLHETISEVCEIFLPAANRKKIRFSNSVSKDVFADIDDTIFGIILNNIISNAINYSGGDNIEIFLAPATETKTKVILTIKDNGTGISNITLSKIRELIKGKLHINRPGEEAGPGLGYILVTELIRIHGLSLSVESEMNRGTAVSLVIPYGSPSSDPEGVDTGVNEMM